MAVVGCHTSRCDQERSEGDREPGHESTTPCSRTSAVGHPTARGRPSATPGSALISGRPARRPAWLKAEAREEAGESPLRNLDGVHVSFAWTSELVCAYTLAAYGSTPTTDAWASGQAARARRRRTSGCRTPRRRSRLKGSHPPWQRQAWRRTPASASLGPIALSG